MKIYSLTFKRSGSSTHAVWSSLSRIFINPGLLFLACMLLAVTGSLRAATTGVGSGFTGFFDGNSYIEISDNPDTKGLTAFTIEAWVLKPSNAIGQETIFGKSNAYNVTFDGANFQFTINGEITPATSTITVKNNEWIHVAFVFDGSLGTVQRKKIYINGVLDVSASSAETTISSNTNKLYIGALTTSTSKFNGFIDEVRFWNTALSATSIRMNMCHQLSGTESGLVGYWRMDDESQTFENSTFTAGLNGTGTAVQSPRSGAPIGSSSTYNYGVSLLSLTSSDGDGLSVSNFSSQPDGIHIYLVNSEPVDGQKPSGFAHLSKYRYFGVFVVKNNGTAVGYDISYDYAGHIGWNTGNEASLKLATRRNNSTTIWDDASAVQDLPGKKLNYSSSAASNSSGQIETVLGSGIDPLPVSLLDFHAALAGASNIVALNWTTASELNNNYFAVERSMDGLNYVEVDRVQGAGTTQEMQRYRSSDVPTQAGLYYYRLKQVDHNGTTEYFSPKKVTLNQGATQIGVNFLCNMPVNDRLVLSIPVSQACRVHTVIRNYNGQIIHDNYITTNGRAEIPGITELPAGQYLIFVNYNGNSEVKKFVKY